MTSPKLSQSLSMNRKHGATVFACLVLLLLCIECSEANNRVPGRDPVLLSARGDSTCFAIGDGSLRCWGANGSGQLGTGTPTTAESTPVTPGGVNFTSVAMGVSHACYVISFSPFGYANCWGNNADGQIAHVDNAVQVTAGARHSCAVIVDGTVSCWGSNLDGRLGASAPSPSPPVSVGGLSGVVSIAAGVDHACAALIDGSVRCWGNNVQGQLGNGTTTMSSARPVSVIDAVTSTPLGHVVSISSGNFHSCARLADGTARCWGRNSAGQLGDGTSIARPRAVSVVGLRNVRALGTGRDHTCALLVDGTIRCWGANGSGQLGNGTTLSSFSPVAISGVTGAAAISAGNSHSCASLMNDTVRCWGANTASQLGISTAIIPTYSAVPVVVSGIAGSISARALSAAYLRTCATRTDGTAACWGLDPGDGTQVKSLPVRVAGLTQVADVVASDHQTCARLGDGSLRCWGSVVPDGQSGGVARLSPVPVVTDATGAQLTNVATTSGGIEDYALLIDGTVKLLGNPYPSAGPPYGTKFPGALASAGWDCFVVDGDGFCAGFEVGPVIALARGLSHQCALLVNGTVMCSGSNSRGQLGYDPGSVFSSPIPLPVPSLFPLNDVVAIAAGDFHTCALRVGGYVWCWGANYDGQLGIGTQTVREAALQVQQYASYDYYGYPAPPFTLTVLDIVSIAAGGNHSCARRVNGAVFCWGENAYGEVGDGTTIARSTPVEVPSFRFNIGPAVELGGHGRVATVTALVNCEEGDQVQVRVSLTQGSTVGHGDGIGACTGGLEGYEVTVPAQGRAFFTTGPAHAEADAIVRSRGAVVDEQEWTRNVQIEVAP
jgi:alpha-tubulin suppressor-like RCC1 family protein